MTRVRVKSLMLFFLFFPTACTEEASPETTAETESEAPAQLPFSASVQVGDTRYFSGWGSRDPATGEHPEGFEAQSEQLMKNLSALLERHGVSFSQVVHANLYIVDSSRLETFYRIYEAFFPDRAPALTTVAIPELPDTQVELTFITSTASELHHIVPEAADEGGAFMSPGVVDGEYLYTSACGGRIYSHDYHLEEDSGDQLESCLNGLDEVLRAAEMEPDDVVKAEIFLTSLNQSTDVGRTLEGYFDGNLPAVTYSGVEALPGGAAVSVSFVATRGGMETEQPVLKSEGASDVLIGERLYLSGRSGKVGMDIGDQVRGVMDELGAVLKSAGMSFSDVADAKVYLADMDDYAAMNGVYGSYFEDGFPTRSCIEMNALPAGAGVQVTLVADSRR